MRHHPPRRRDAGHVGQLLPKADLAVAAVDDIRRIFRVLRVAARRAERELGLSGAQVFVLEKLSEAPAGSLNELADRTLTHQSSVSVVVERLVQRGLVTRERSLVDGRRILLQLTPGGERLAQKASPAPQTQLVDAVRGFRAGELRTFVRLLRRVTGAMGASRATPDMMFTEITTQASEAVHRSSRTRDGA